MEFDSNIKFLSSYQFKKKTLETSTSTHSIISFICKGVEIKVVAVHYMHNNPIILS